MFRSTLLLLAGSLGFAAGLHAADPVVVRQLDLVGLRADVPRNSEVGSPLVIADEAALRRIFLDEKIRDRLLKAVDFKKDQLVFFGWRGPSDDDLAVHVLDRKQPPIVAFEYVRGRSNQPRGQFKLFALPRDIDWRVDLP
jgi:hypothetical protein